ncbi:MAG: histidinol-phosphate transaminase [Caulobacterales bacterium]
MAPQPRPGILDIPIYKGGDAQSKAARVFKLSSNENPLGASPAARAAYLEAVEKLPTYPDGHWDKLRQAIGARYGLDPERILCGCGSDEFLFTFARAYLNPGDEAIYTRYGFSIYPIATRQAGGVPVIAEETNLRADVDAILSVVTPRTKIVFLANPNNPTGTYLTSADLRRLKAGLPPHVLLVLDAAYAEFVRRNDYSAGIELVAESDNVVMTRTFSKIYGLAAIRIGWCYAPQSVVDVFHRLRPPFNLSGPAIAAGAAAVADEKFLVDSVDFNTRELDKLHKGLSALGLVAAESVANFLLLRFPQTPGKSAQDADVFLRDRGLVARGMSSYGLADCLRLSVGPEEANDLVISALAEFMKS